jgi:lysozyme
MNTNARVSPNGIAVIEYFEHCALKAYPDPKTGGAPWTCGVGATGPGIGPGTVWTQAQANARLVQDLLERESAARSAIRVETTPGQFDAFISILFNVGAGSRAKDGIVRLRNASPSTLLRKLNAGDYAGAREQFARWISPGTRVELGLRRRRRAEQALWDGLTGAQAIALGAAVK